MGRRRRGVRPNVEDLLHLCSIPGHDDIDTHRCVDLGKPAGCTHMSPSWKALVKSCRDGQGAVPSGSMRESPIHLQIKDEVEAYERLQRE
jgi:hypothetical protein